MTDFIDGLFYNDDDEDETKTQGLRSRGAEEQMPQLFGEGAIQSRTMFCKFTESIVTEDNRSIQRTCRVPKRTTMALSANERAKKEGAEAPATNEGPQGRIEGTPPTDEEGPNVGRGPCYKHKGQTEG